MKLISWNVNGIRSVIQKGFLDYLGSESPDIICMQEVKAEENQFPARMDIEMAGYKVFWNHAEKKGYSGVAIFTKEDPISVTYGFGVEEHDKEGRLITLEFQDFHLLNVYTPNSKRELERLPYRQLWDSLFLDYIKKLEETKPVIVCGDLNVAHKDIDLTNPKTNRGNAGFTDEERNGFQKFIDNNLIDTYRYFYPDVEKKYSWWSNFANAREKNIGWRIDYFLISESLKYKLVNAFIHETRKGSDHCPVGIIINCTKVPGCVEMIYS